MSSAFRQVVELLSTATEPLSVAQVARMVPYVTPHAARVYLSELSGAGLVKRHDSETGGKSTYSNAGLLGVLATQSNIKAAIAAYKADSTLTPAKPQKPVTPKPAKPQKPEPPAVEINYEAVDRLIAKLQLFEKGTDPRSVCIGRIGKEIGINQHNQIIDWLDTNRPGWRGHPNPVLRTSSRWVA